MRVRVDPTSYRARGVLVRDARHTHADPETPKPARGKKDTKRWCGGKVGREHKPQCMVKREWTASPSGEKRRWYVLSCTVCGKELAHHFPGLWPARQATPEWVTP